MYLYLDLYPNVSNRRWRAGEEMPAEVRSLSNQPWDPPQPPIQPNPTLLTVQNIWKLVHFHAVGLPLSPQSHPSNSLEHSPLHIWGLSPQSIPTKVPYLISSRWRRVSLASVEAQLGAPLKNVDLWRRWELPLADFKSLATLRGNNGRPMKKLQIKQFFGRFWQLSRKLPESKRALLKLLLTLSQRGNKATCTEPTRQQGGNWCQIEAWTEFGFWVEMIFFKILNIHFMQCLVYLWIELWSSHRLAFVNWFFSSGSIPLLLSQWSRAASERS